MISRDVSVTKDQYIKATKQPYSFLYVDKPMKTAKRNFYRIYNIMILMGIFNQKPYNKQ